MKIKKDRKKQLSEIRSQLTDRDVFLSDSYHHVLRKFARALGQKKELEVQIFYDEKQENNIAYTDGQLITLNAANVVTRNYLEREAKVKSHEGLVAHECGHVRYTDFDRRYFYLNGLRQGICYPCPPQRNSAAEERAWKEFEKFLKTRDPAAIFCMQKVAGYLNNVLEDVYVESLMCQEYPGSVRQTIQSNAAVVIKAIPSAQERELEGNSLSLMLDLIFRYARAGETEEESQYSKAHRMCLKRCKPVIRTAVFSEDADIRFHATNRLMLIIWKYLKEQIRDARKELREKNPGQMPNDQRKALEDYWRKKIHWNSLSSGADASSGGKTRTMPEEWKNQAAEQNHSEESTESSKEMETLWEEQKKFAKGENESSEQGKDGKDIWSLLTNLPAVLNETAGQRLHEKEEEQLRNRLQEELKQTPFGELHKDCQFQLHRELEISEGLVQNYECLKPEIKKISKRLQESASEILEKKEGGTLNGLYMGKRLSRASLYRQDGRIFEKKVLPEDGFSVAFALLVDVSGSMNSDSRITYARNAALVLYDFCQTLSIPVMVYGHSTHYPSDGRVDEVVDICAYADFDSTDGKDALRIAGMEIIGANRDGAALQFVGERLLKREEEFKILVLISDGRPSACQYGGEMAKKDLQDIKRRLERRGVHVFAAAVGEDREIIESIYKEGFLNISDMKTMPAKFAALLTKYMKR